MNIYPIVKRPYLQQPPPWAKINQTAVGADALVACWVMNQTAGKKVFDYGPYSVHGTFNPTSTTVITHDRTHTNNGLLFTGNNNNHRVDLGSIASDHPLSLSSLNSCSVVARYAFYNTNTNSFPRLIDKSTTGGATNGWGVYYSGTNLVFAVDGGERTVASAVEAGGTGPTRTIGFSVKDFGAFADSIFYRDGYLRREIINNSCNTPPAATANMAIGNWNHSTDRAWEGTVECIMVFNRWLSHQELRVLTTDPYILFDHGPIMDQFIIVPPAVTSGQAQRLFVISN